MTIELDQPPRLVYSYEEAGSECEVKKMANWEKFFGPFILIDYELTTRHYAAGIRGRPFIYEGRFHLFQSYVQNKTHFLQWGASIVTFNGNEFRRSQSNEYERKSICGFEDSEIFYPPPRR